MRATSPIASARRCVPRFLGKCSSRLAASRQDWSHHPGGAAGFGYDPCTRHRWCGHPLAECPLDEAPRSHRRRAPLRRHLERAMGHLARANIRNRRQGLRRLRWQARGARRRHRPRHRPADPEAPSRPRLALHRPATRRSSTNLRSRDPTPNANLNPSRPKCTPLPAPARLPGEASRPQTLRLPTHPRCAARDPRASPEGDR